MYGRKAEKLCQIPRCYVLRRIKMFKTGGYLSYQDTFVWRKITVNTGEAPAPFSATYGHWQLCIICYNYNIPMLIYKYINTYICMYI